MLFASRSQRIRRKWADAYRQAMHELVRDYGPDINEMLFDRLNRKAFWQGVRAVERRHGRIEFRALLDDEIAMIEHYSQRLGLDRARVNTAIIQAERSNPGLQTAFSLAALATWEAHQRRTGRDHREGRP
jgi:hypothetical protein